MPSVCRIVACSHDVYRILHDVVAVIVRLAEADAWFDTAAREPHRKASRMMIAAVVVGGQLALAIHGPSKFAAPHYQRVLQ
jgi:hypothetical protein